MKPADSHQGFINFNLMTLGSRFENIRLWFRDNFLKFGHSGQKFGFQTLELTVQLLFFVFLKVIICGVLDAEALDIRKAQTAIPSF